MEHKHKSGLLGEFGERKLLSFTLVLFTLAIGMVLGTLISGDAGAAREGKAAPDATLLTVPDPVPVENEFSRIAKTIRPSVVHIKVETLPQKSEAGQQGERNLGDEMFRRFFGLPEGRPGPGPSPFRRPGEGSGVIVDPNGYIITNHHVVQQADRIRVRLFNNGSGGDEELVEAKLIGADPETDLAVIKIDAGRALKTAPIGNSDAVTVGDWAIAVGSPFGYEETVTVGIISAKSREVGARKSFQRFLQTDAAINPGNSGGPLLNIRGEVIGINTAIVSRSGGSEGLGFSMPSNTAVKVYNQIIQHGKVTRGSIGVKFSAEQPAALLRSYGAQEGGVLVTEIHGGGPADKAGMKAEDVIVEIDGTKIRNGDKLIETVASKNVGDTIPIAVMRQGQRVTLDVEIADRAVLFGEELGYVTPENEKERETAQIMFGIEVSNLSAEDRKQLDLKEKDGVLVTTVDPASFADDIGMLPNDIILTINREPVSQIDDIRKIQNNLKPGDDVAFKVTRRVPGQEKWITSYLAGVLPKDKDGRF